MLRYIVWTIRMEAARDACLVTPRNPSIYEHNVTDTNGYASIQGKAFGGFRVQMEILWYPPFLSTSWLNLEGTHGSYRNQTILLKEKTKDISRCLKFRWIFEFLLDMA